MGPIVARSNTAEPAHKLQTFMRDHIPITQTMGLEVRRADPTRVTIAAPLAPNVNDKGSAFGGSMASVATLAGWGLVWLKLNDEDGYDIMIRDTQLRYRRPVYAELVATANVLASQWQSFESALQARGRARIEISITIDGDEGAAMDMHGTYVARRRA